MPAQGYAGQPTLARPAAAAILAIAPPDHPLHVKAKAILASR
jgi:hypothetical protein